VAELTTTSYAILGLLSLRPHTAYDLTQQARRSLRFVWPTSESQLYAEPKRLAREGLIDRTLERVGQRSRQVYGINDAGRAALRTWLETSPRAPAAGSEILLRVMFADGSDKDALLASLAAWRRRTEAEMETGRAFVREHLAGDAPHAERANLNTLWWALTAEQLRTTLSWIDFAEREVRAWRDTGPRAFDRRTRRLATLIAAGEPLLTPSRA
jgi:PadR family transcriptional regulator, regulatory protein AphA